MDELMTTDEVSAYTRVPKGTFGFYRYANDGRGPRWIKLGRRVVYRRSDVEAWVAAQSAAADDSAA